MPIRRKPPFPPAHFVLLTGLVLGLAAFASGGRAANPSAPPIDRLIDFQQNRYGLPPPEFDYDAAGPLGPVTLGGRPAWRTSVDLFAPSPKFVLIQASAQPGAEHFPMALLRDLDTDAPALAVSFKVVSGAVSPGAGLLWRAQQRDEFEAVLMGGPEQRREARLLRISHGQPRRLASARVAFASDEWHSLEVSALPAGTTVWLNGRQVLGAPAPTPTRSGRVGLITWSDTVALFDDFHVQAGRERVVRRTAPKPEPRLATTLHVAEILTTAADFRTPQTVFAATGKIYWRVRVADARSQPSPGAVVGCELIGASGQVFGDGETMTGTDGVAWFSHTLSGHAAPGPCRVRVRSVVHASEPEAAYAPQSNRQSSAPFTLRPTPR